MRLFVILSCVFISFSFEAMAKSSNSYSVQRILERYKESLGGSRSVAALSSLSIEGYQIQDGTSYQFLMRKKRPNSIRYRLTAHETSVVCGFNGRQGWQRTKVGGEVTIEDLSTDQLSALRDEADFDSPLINHLEKSWNQIFLVGNEQLGDTFVNVLEVRKFRKPFVRYYLNSTSGLVLKRVQIHADGTFGLETLYRDYREIDGYQFAFEIENRISDQLVSLVRIETIEVNPGLLSFYFEKPKN
ncbi:MAG TPA: hypothetical protein DCR32_06150 [Opitutae bacterium]|jgi:hypothetical protein|nr:hypothetical protein [Opitutae bacterium]